MSLNHIMYSRLTRKADSTRSRDTNITSIILVLALTTVVSLGLTVPVPLRNT
jgi:hypothetical protein